MNEQPLRNQNPPKFRDHFKSEALRWREKAQIGDVVVTDCDIFGMSVWRRNEDGTIVRVEPSSVVFHVNEEPVVSEIPPGGSFPAHRISEWQRPL